MFGEILSHSLTDEPDLLIVNPPRQGLSEEFRARPLELKTDALLYSSPDSETFARNVSGMISDYDLKILAPFDMLPITNDCEALGIL